MNIKERGQQRAIGDGKVVESRDCLAWRSLRSISPTVHKYLKGGCKEDTDRLSPLLSSERLRSNGQELKCSKFTLNSRNALLKRECG